MGADLAQGTLLKRSPSMIALALKCMLLVACVRTVWALAVHVRGIIMNRAFWQRIDGKWIAVTGASDGIGRELAIGLARRHQKVILVGRSREKLEAVRKEVLACAAECRVIVTDFERMPEGDIFAGYDLGMLINNAGCSSAHPSYVYEDTLMQIVAVNVSTPLLITQSVLEKMARNRFGYVLNIGSVLSECPTPLLATYGATKAMVKAWSSSLYYEMRPHGVHVECVIPGLVCTKMSKVRRPSLMAPTARTFAECVLRSCGTNRISVPYLPHLLSYVALGMVPSFLAGQMFYQRAMSIRSLALGRKRRD